MPLVTTKEMFEKALKGGYAIGAFNVDNMDIMKAVLRACEKAKSPVIIAISSGALKFIGEEYIRKVVDGCAEEFSIPFALHLDHGKSVDLCKRCVDIGFSSVMIDASAYDFEENIRPLVVSSSNLNLALSLVLKKMSSSMINTDNSPTQIKLKNSLREQVSIH